MLLKLAETVMSDGTLQETVGNCTCGITPELADVMYTFFYLGTGVIGIATIFFCGLFLWKMCKWIF